MEWIISANQNVYNHKAAFEKWGFIDWKQKAKYSVGDIVYIYLTSPKQAVKYKCQVVMSNKTSNDIDDQEYCENIDFSNYSIMNYAIKNNIDIK